MYLMTAFTQHGLELTSNLKARKASWHGWMHICEAKGRGDEEINHC